MGDETRMRIAMLACMLAFSVLPLPIHVFHPVNSLASSAIPAQRTRITLILFNLLAIVYLGVALGLEVHGLERPSWICQAAAIIIEILHMVFEAALYILLIARVHLIDSKAQYRKVIQVLASSTPLVFVPVLISTLTTRVQTTDCSTHIPVYVGAINVFIKSIFIGIPLALFTVILNVGMSRKESIGKRRTLIVRSMVGIMVAFSSTLTTYLVLSSQPRWTMLEISLLISFDVFINLSSIHLTWPLKYYIVIFKCCKCCCLAYFDEPNTKKRISPARLPSALSTAAHVTRNTGSNTRPLGEIQSQPNFASMRKLETMMRKNNRQSTRESFETLTPTETFLPGHQEFIKLGKQIIALHGQNPQISRPSSQLTRPPSAAVQKPTIRAVGENLANLSRVQLPRKISGKQGQ
ncbi:hypothetical protein AAMO2058_001089700 [Amorphochlora amoebiformis]